ncbi:unnamed protein product [Amoebophrya sp. A25]|nr:unnamed protein product [Amoebophrya sp. A25]|eukprot:GSA25T00000141001.1
MLLSRYHVERELGRGSFGVVYLCRDTDSQPVSPTPGEDHLKGNNKRSQSESSSRGAETPGAAGTAKSGDHTAFVTVKTIHCPQPDSSFLFATAREASSNDEAQDDEAGGAAQGGALGLPKDGENDQQNGIEQGRAGNKKKNDVLHLAMREAEVLRRLRHPFIVGYKDMVVDEKRDSLHIVMEFCENGDLAQLLKRVCRLEQSVALVYAWQLASALAYCHSQRVLHRDLKPRNIFLTKNFAQLRLGDFGVCRVQEGTGDLASTMIGTPLYLSPEICGNQRYDAKSDVWGLGVAVYEMFVGVTPFGGPAPPLRPPQEGINSNIQIGGPDCGDHVAGNAPGGEGKKPPPGNRAAVLLAIATMPLKMNVLRSFVTNRHVAHCLALCLSKRPQRRPSAGTAAGVFMKAIESLRRLGQFTPKVLGVPLADSEQIIEEALFGRQPQDEENQHDQKGKMMQAAPAGIREVEWEHTEESDTSANKVQEQVSELDGGQPNISVREHSSPSGSASRRNRHNKFLRRESEPMIMFHRKNPSYGSGPTRRRGSDPSSFAGRRASMAPLSARSASSIMSAAEVLERHAQNDLVAVGSATPLLRRHQSLSFSSHPLPCGAEKVELLGEERKRKAACFPLHVVPAHQNKGTTTMLGLNSEQDGERSRRAFDSEGKPGSSSREAPGSCIREYDKRRDFNRPMNLRPMNLRSPSTSQRDQQHEQDPSSSMRGRLSSIFNAAGQIRRDCSLVSLANSHGDEGCSVLNPQPSKHEVEEVIMKIDEHHDLDVEEIDGNENDGTSNSTSNTMMSNVLTLKGDPEEQEERLPVEEDEDDSLSSKLQKNPPGNNFISRPHSKTTAAGTPAASSPGGEEDDAETLKIDIDVAAGFSPSDADASPEADCTTLVGILPPSGAAVARDTAEVVPMSRPPRLPCVVTTKVGFGVVLDHRRGGNKTCDVVQAEVAGGKVVEDTSSCRKDNRRGDQEQDNGGCRDDNDINESHQSGAPLCYSTLTTPEKDEKVVTSGTGLDAVDEDALVTFELTAPVPSIDVAISSAGQAEGTSSIHQIENESSCRSSRLKSQNNVEDDERASPVSSSTASIGGGTPGSSGRAKPSAKILGMISHWESHLAAQKEKNASPAKRSSPVPHSATWSPSSATADIEGGSRSSTFNPMSRLTAPTTDKSGGETNTGAGSKKTIFNVELRPTVNSYMLLDRGDGADEDSRLFLKRQDLSSFQALAEAENKESERANCKGDLVEKNCSSPSLTSSLGNSLLKRRNDSAGNVSADSFFSSPASNPTGESMPRIVARAPAEKENKDAGRNDHDDIPAVSFVELDLLGPQSAPQTKPLLEASERLHHAERTPDTSGSTGHASADTLRSHLREKISSLWKRADKAPSARDRDVYRVPSGANTLKKALDLQNLSPLPSPSTTAGRSSAYKAGAFAGIGVSGRPSSSATGGLQRGRGNDDAIRKRVSPRAIPVTIQQSSSLEESPSPSASCAPTEANAMHSKRPTAASASPASSSSSARTKKWSSSTVSQPKPLANRNVVKTVSTEEDDHLHHECLMGSTNLLLSRTKDNVLLRQHVHRSVAEDPASTTASGLKLSDTNFEYSKSSEKVPRSEILDEFLAVVRRREDLDSRNSLHSAPSRPRTTAPMVQQQPGTGTVRTSVAAAGNTTRNANQRVLPSAAVSKMYPTTGMASGNGTPTTSIQGPLAAPGPGVKRSTHQQSSSHSQKHKQPSSFSSNSSSISRPVTEDSSKTASRPRISMGVAARRGHYTSLTKSQRLRAQLGRVRSGATRLSVVNRSKAKAAVENFVRGNARRAAGAVPSAASKKSVMSTCVSLSAAGGAFAITTSSTTKSKWPSPLEGAGPAVSSSSNTKAFVGTKTRPGGVSSVDVDKKPRSIFPSPEPSPTSSIASVLSKREYEQADPDSSSDYDLIARVPSSRNCKQNSWMNNFSKDSAGPSRTPLSSRAQAPAMKTFNRNRVVTHQVSSGTPTDEILREVFESRNPMLKHIRDLQKNQKNAVFAPSQRIRSGLNEKIAGSSASASSSTGDVKVHVQYHSKSGQSAGTSSASSNISADKVMPSATKANRDCVRTKTRAGRSSSASACGTKSSSARTARQAPVSICSTSANAPRAPLSSLPTTSSAGGVNTKDVAVGQERAGGKGETLRSCATSARVRGPLSASSAKSSKANYTSGARQQLLSKDKRTPITNHDGASSASTTGAKTNKKASSRTCDASSLLGKKKVIAASIADSVNTPGCEGGRSKQAGTSNTVGDSAAVRASCKWGDKPTALENAARLEAILSAAVCVDQPDSDTEPE